MMEITFLLLRNFQKRFATRRTPLADGFKHKQRIFPPWADLYRSQEQSPQYKDRRQQHDSVSLWSTVPERHREPARRRAKAVTIPKWYASTCVEFYVRSVLAETLTRVTSGEARCQ